MRSNPAFAALLIALSASTAKADEGSLSPQEMAQAIVSLISPVWKGPRTAAPEPVERPSGASLTIRSPYSSSTVHAVEGVTERRLRQTLQSLEYARSRLSALAWPAPISDGDLGGGAGVDVYLTGALPPGAYSDGIAPWSYLDRASTFAVVNPEVPTESLDACVTSAYAEAMLLSADPAEAPEWRRATAAWLTWELTGTPGCDDATFRQQAEPFRSWVRGAAGAGSGGWILLAFLSERHDSTSPEFVRDVWALASQRTWEGDELRAEPDLWSAIDVAVSASGDRLLDNVEELAVLRWFVGRGAPADPLVAAIDDDAKAPVSRRMTRLPSRVTSAEPLQSFGSAYVVVDSSAWKTATRLRAWLRGEYGVRWSLTAAQLDSSQNEIRRVTAPHTSGAPNAYVPIEIDPSTRALLLVVTNLSSGLPDADEEDLDERSFELIVDAAND